MTYNKVIYRGAKTTLAEVNADLVKPAEKTTGQMQYRGAKGEVSLASHRPRKQKVTYRGATAIMEVQPSALLELKTPTRKAAGNGCLF